MKYLLKLTFSFLIATYVAVFVGWQTPATQKQCLLVWLVVFFIARYLSTIFFRRYVDERPLNRRVIVLSLCFSAVVAGLGYPYLVPVEMEGRAQITLTALGEKDSASAASEIWIKGIDNGGGAYDLTTLSMGRGWERKPDNLIVSYRDQPASLTITVDKASSPVVRFLEHPWSGKVSISDGNKVTVVNLYKKDHGEYAYSIGNISRVRSESNLAKQVLFVLLAVAFLFSTIYALWEVFTDSRKLSERRPG